MCLEKLTLGALLPHMQENASCGEISVVVVAEMCDLKNKNQTHEQPVTCMKSLVLEPLGVAIFVM